MSQINERFTPTDRGAISQLFEAMRRAGTGHELFFSGADAIWNVHKSKYLNEIAFQETVNYEYLIKGGYDVSGLSSPNSGDVVAGYYNDIDKTIPQADQLRRMAHCEFRLRLPELLLMRLDKITMSNSIEGRVPFLDHNLVDFTMKIPQKYKINNRIPKYLLKKVFSNLLPNEVVNRKKMGFAAPVAHWFKGEFGRFANAVIMESKIHEHGFLNKAYIADRFHEHRSGKADHSLHLWIVFNLVSWYNHWVNGH